MKSDFIILEFQPLTQMMIVNIQLRVGIDTEYRV